MKDDTMKDDSMKDETATTTKATVEKKPGTKKVAKKATKAPAVKKEVKKPVKVKKDKPLRTTNKWKVRKEVADALTKKYGFGPAVPAVDIVSLSDDIVMVLVNEIPYSVIRESGEVAKLATSGEVANYVDMINEDMPEMYTENSKPNMLS